MKVNSIARILAAGLGLTIAGFEPNASQTAQPPSGQVQVYEEQVSPGTITLRVRPVLQDTVLVFEIAADTHSGDLASLDLAEATRLRIGDSETEPVQATRLDGHHATARVTFHVTSIPERFVLLIAAAGEEPVRVLEWPRKRPGGASARRP